MRRHPENPTCPLDRKPVLDQSLIDIIKANPHRSNFRNAVHHLSRRPELYHVRLFGNGVLNGAAYLLKLQQLRQSLSLHCINLFSQSAMLYALNQRQILNIETLAQSLYLS